MKQVTKRPRRTQAKPERVTDAPRSGLLNLWQWRERNAHLFPSDTSLRWHLRQHRETYIAAGALFEVGGRYVCDPAKFEQTLRTVGTVAARSREEVMQ